MLREFDESGQIARFYTGNISENGNENPDFSGLSNLSFILENISFRGQQQLGGNPDLIPILSLFLSLLYQTSLSI